MDGAKGSALEWALALFRAPGERYVLRCRPLPAGMDDLLGVAAGVMPDELAQAARAFGETDARIREAAQFYAREVLFFPQADAYRVLGVSADASMEQIKAHHRLLQHWLHPDRLHSQEDAIFASRVNGAWNRLRNAERRSTYDASLPREHADGTDVVPMAFQGFNAWAPQSPTSGHWRHRLPAIILSLICIALVALAIRDLGREPESWAWPDSRLTAIADEAHLSVDTALPEEMREIERPRSRKAAEPAEPRMVEVHPAFQAPSAGDRAVPAEKAQVPPAVQQVTSAPSAPAVASLGASMQQNAPLQGASQSGQQAVIPPENGLSQQGIGGQDQAPTQAQIPNGWESDPAQIQAALRTGDAFLRYMGGAGRSSPPIWSSPAIQSSAYQLREELHRQATSRLAPPRWRIGNELAALTSTYRVPASGEDGISGYLTADLAWREGQWLVVGISLERSQ